MRTSEEDLRAWAELMKAAPADPGIRASILCRLAARFWVMAGGTSEGFAGMARSQADAEMSAQREEP